VITSTSAGYAKVYSYNPKSFEEVSSYELWAFQTPTRMRGGEGHKAALNDGRRPKFWGNIHSDDQNFATAYTAYSPSAPQRLGSCLGGGSGSQAQPAHQYPVPSVPGASTNETFNEHQPPSKNRQRGKHSAPCHVAPNERRSMRERERVTP
jgi:hypothetical protein